MKSKVSILVPIYGVENYIARCAHSLFKQDYQNLEFLFVDDCSSDASIYILNQVLLQYPNRIKQVKIITHKENLGLSAARNTALQNASGEYIMHVDSDDYLDSSNAISCLVQKAIAQDSDVVFFDFKLIYPHTVKVYNTSMPTIKENLIDSILKRETSLTIWGGLYKRSVFLANNIRSIDNISMGEDFVVKARVAYYLNRIEYIKEAYYCYDQTNSKSITRNFRPTWIDDLEKTYVILNKFYKDKPDFFRYKKNLQIGAVRAKLNLFYLWSCSKGLTNDFYKIQRLFPNVDVHLGDLRGVDRVIYIFTTYKCVFLLKLFSKIGILLRKIMLEFNEK